MKLTKTFIEDIRELICSVRTAVARGVDLVQVHTNFEIGRRIVQEEQKGKRRADYGKEVIKALAERLTGEFGNGFSKSNLEYMRRFYLAYEDRGFHIAQTASGQLSALKITQTTSDLSPLNVIGQALSDQSAISGKAPVSSGQAPPAGRLFSLSWSHYVFLLGIKNTDERSFYEIESTQQNWTIRELKRQFDSSLYERLALSRDKEGIRQLAREGQIVNHFQLGIFN